MNILHASTTQPFHLIPALNFDVCLIDGRTRAEIKGMFKGAKRHESYYLAKFSRYLMEKHGITLKDYCVQYGGIQWPTCPGTGEEVNYHVRSKDGLVLCRYARHRGPTKENCEGMRRKSRQMAKRVGAKNPLFGRSGWSKGKTAKTDTRVAVIASKRKGAIRTPAMRKRMSDAHKARWKAATPEKRAEMANALRLRVAKARASGAFDQETTIHRKMRAFLASLSLREAVVEEFQVGYYCVDFAFPNMRVAIECDGDYFHCNPLLFPNGPKDATQSRNVKREKFRTPYLKDAGWKIIHVWECDINAGTFKEHLPCRLRESGLLNH